MSLHSQQTAIHKIENWSFADAAARVANGPYVANDVGKISFQQDIPSYWRLQSIAFVSGVTYTPTWVAIGGGFLGIQNNYAITSINGAEPTSLKNFNVTGLTFGHIMAITLADSTQLRQFQNGAPTGSDGLVASNSGYRWRKTGGF